MAHLKHLHHACENSTAHNAQIDQASIRHYVTGCILSAKTGTSGLGSAQHKQALLHTWKLWEAYLDVQQGTDLAQWGLPAAPEATWTQTQGSLCEQ